MRNEYRMFVEKHEGENKMDVHGSIILKQILRKWRTVERS
jgi:hypothetical protein